MFELVDFFEIVPWINAVSATYGNEWQGIWRGVLSGAYLVVFFGLLRQIAMRTDFLVSGLMRRLGSRPFEIQYALEPFLIRLRLFGIILALSIFGLETVSYYASDNAGSSKLELDRSIEENLSWLQSCFYEIDEC